MTKNEARQSNIELLRILLGCAVVILHFNYYGDSGVSLYVTGANFAAMTLGELLCNTAVDAFIIISGYFSFRKKRVNPAKVLFLLLQVSVFREAIYLLPKLIKGEFAAITGGQVLLMLLPVNYYVVLYAALVLISPYLSAAAERADEHEFNIMILVCFGIFSVCATAVDVLAEIFGSRFAGLSPIGLSGSDSGYTIVNFILCWLAGAWLRRTNALERIKTGKAVALFATSVVLLAIWRVILPKTASYYSNPLFIIQAGAMLLLFLKLDFKSTIINKLSPAAFTCYLIHPYLLGRVDFETVAAKSTSMFIITAILTAIVIYAVSFALYWLWERIMAPMLKKTAEAFDRRGIIIKIGDGD